MLWIFWISLIGLVYIYVGYPLLVWWIARLRPFPEERSLAPDARLSVIIAAFNEGAVLEAKVASLLTSTVADRISEILIASDASTDDTEAVVNRLRERDGRIRLLAFPARRGKAACVNDAVADATGELLILTDARQEVAPDALERLVNRFGDPSVGVVSGELVFLREDVESSTTGGMGAYWEYEKFLRRAEARIHSVPGATGALYALRRSLYRQIPEDTLLDDVVIPMHAVEQRYRCVFETGAHVFDRVSVTAAQEKRRKRRTLTGCVQLLVRYPGWMNPLRCPIWWQFGSHKIARLASPLLLGLLLVASVVLRETWICGVVLVGQVVLYVLALGAWGLERVGRPAKHLGVLLLFLGLNLTILGALWDGFRGQFQARWKEE